MTDATERNDGPDDDEEREPTMARECPCCSRDYLHDDDETGNADDLPTTEWRSTVDDDEVCERCADRHYVYGSRDDAYIHTDYAVYLNDADCYVTDGYAESNCYQNDDGEWYEERPTAGNILDYGDDVLERCEYDSRALRNGALMFGVELEMEPTGDADQDDVARALGGPIADRYILKEDGSLDSGVELVTIPMTLDGHRTRFDWPAVLARVRGLAKSGRNTTNCGMHVHINKAALSALTIGKMLVFLNSQRTARLVTLIAQRESNGYCSRDESKKITDGKWNSDNRYDIANVGPRTVEFRLFRGNLRPDRVLKNLEFCHAVVNYCKDASMQTLENPELFSQYILKRRGEYPELVKYLAEARASYFQGAVRVRKDAPAPTIQPEV